MKKAEVEQTWILDERVRYFNRGEQTQNFGDYLPELIASELFLHPRIEADVYRLIGSVIDIKWLQRDLRFSIGSKQGVIAIWGCGARAGQSLVGNIPDGFKFFGVRGELTRKVLGLPEDTALGDPGLLLPIIHSPKKSVKTSGKSICIKHVHDTRNEEDLLVASGADIILSPIVESNLDALRNIIDNIVQAEFVLTASLHGAIIAAAYGRPFAFWDNGIIDIEFKWEDFASSVGIESQFAKNVNEGRVIYQEYIQPIIKLPSLVKILDICPFYVKPSAFLKAAVVDGHLNESSINDASNFLESLHSFESDEILRMSLSSKIYRYENRKFKTYLIRFLGRSYEAIKLFIRLSLRIK